MTLRTQVGMTLDRNALKNFLQPAGSLQASSPTSFPSWPSFLTARCLPVGTLPTNIFGTFNFPSNVTGSETFVLAWRGTASHASGAIQLVRGSPGFAVTSDPGSSVIGSTAFNLNASGTDGYIEFNLNGTTATTITLQYRSGSVFSGMTKMVICRKVDYASCINPATPSELWADDFVHAWAELQPSTIRMLGTFTINESCNITQRRYLPHWSDAIYFGGPSWIPNTWVGQITGTNTYSCFGATDTPSSYTHGEVIQGYFQNASNSTGQTIDVASRGAVPIKASNGSALGASAISANTPSTLIYDDLLGGFLLFGGTGYGSGLGSVPIELLVAFCNMVGSGVWLNLPAHITTSNSTMEPTNSVSQIVGYVSSNLTGGDFYLEYGNEIWNYAGSIGDNTTFADNCGIAFGFPSDNNRRHYGFYGYKIATIAPLARTAWSSSKRLKLVNAFQAAGPTSATNTYRLQGSDLASVANGGQGNSTWVIYTGDSNYKTSGSRPVDLVDTLAYATHWSGKSCQNFNANYQVVGSSKTITNISSAATGVITYGSDPGYSSGVRVLLSSITGTGTPTLSGTSCTLKKITPTTYEMYSDINQASGIDTTGFTYTSGGVSNQYTSFTDFQALVTWADLYATDPAAALLLLDADFEGTNNGETTSRFTQTLFPAWEAIAAGYDNSRPSGMSILSVENYEGAFEAIAPSTATCTALGYSTTYAASISAMLTAYKNSHLFYSRCRNFINDFLASTNTAREITGCWFLFSGTGQWSMSASDTYGPFYQSYYAVKHLNSGRRRLKVST